MIRIIKENEYCWGIYDCCYCNSKKMLTAIDIDTFGIKTTIYDLNDITKIEKKVKDLTNEEMIKLKMTVVYDANKQAYVVTDMLGNKLSLDDYVDILSIIKGE